MIEALTTPVILLALANGIRQWRAMRERQPQRDEVQQLLALLCERLHERLQQDGTPPRTVINLTAGQWHEITMTPTTSPMSAKIQARRLAVLGV